MTREMKRTITPFAMLPSEKVCIDLRGFVDFHLLKIMLDRRLSGDLYGYVGTNHLESIQLFFDLLGE